MIESGTYNPFVEVFLPMFSLLLAIFLGILILIFWRNKVLRRNNMEQAQDLVMLQILVPKRVIKKDNPQEIKEDFRELISVIEQLYSAVAGQYEKGLFWWIFGQPRLSFELIAKAGEILFYIGVPKKLQSFFEKQIYSVYPDAQIIANKDFKIFGPDLKIAAGYLKLSRKFIYPIKTYKNLESDPLNGITNSLSKLGEKDRATIQFLVRPNSGYWRYACSEAARNVAAGKMIHESWWQKMFLGLFNLFGQSLQSKDVKDKMFESEKNQRLTPQQEELMKAFQAKGAKVGLDTQIKIVVVSPSEIDAKMNLENIAHSFFQFTAPEWNGFKHIKVADNDKKFLTNFILRSFYGPRNIINTEELATMYHLPNHFIETPNIKWLLSRFLAPPANLPQEGTTIGEAIYRGEKKTVKIKDDDRRRHIFMIGKTGVGKTTLYLTMIKQDIEKGRGCCFIDPNGDAAETILRFIPKERSEDVIYFDPSDTDRPMGLNLLEWKRPEDKDYLIAEWLEIFYKLFDPNRTGMVGPQFEHWGRNAALTIMSQPGGGTLIEIPRLFVDDAFRKQCISYVKDPVVLSFWEQQMAKTADFHKSEMYNYFISKFGRFMTNDIIRNIIGQQKSAFDIREIMDRGKILIINLSKGKLGEMNSYLLGMILVSKIQVAAFQRADTPEEQRRDFYLYVDEFQNFTTDSFKTILSEARKYKLNLAVANQYIQQLTEPIRDACIGNAGTLLCYRVGAADAEFMAKEFPGVSESDLTNLPFATLYAKLLIDGSPSKPFSMHGIKTEPPLDKDLSEAIRQLSRLKFGQDKLGVEAAIRQRTLSQNNSVEESLPPRES